MRGTVPVRRRVVGLVDRHLRPWVRSPMSLSRRSAASSKRSSPRRFISASSRATSSTSSDDCSTRVPTSRRRRPRGSPPPRLAAPHVARVRVACPLRRRRRAAQASEDVGTVLRDRLGLDAVLGVVGDLEGAAALGQRDRLAHRVGDRSA